MALASKGPRGLIVELSKSFFSQGWCPGTGGGISIRDGNRIYMAPGGVPKEQLCIDNMFVFDMDGTLIDGPADASLEPTPSKKLFLHAFRERDAGAVIHTHSPKAVLMTLICETEFHITHQEMLKGLRGKGYASDVSVPIIENMGVESDLSGRFHNAVRAYPNTDCVLIRRHGLYAWGKDWRDAKVQVECYDYLFSLALEMRRLGLDPSHIPDAY